MAKNVALANDVYEMLEKMKKPGESFSGVIRRMSESEKRPNWRASIGIFKDDKELLAIYDKTLKERHIVKKRRGLKW